MTTVNVDYKRCWGSYTQYRSAELAIRSAVPNAKITSGATMGNDIIISLVEAGGKPVNEQVWRGPQYLLGWGDPEKTKREIGENIIAALSKLGVDPKA